MTRKTKSRFDIAMPEEGAAARPSGPRATLIGAREGGAGRRGPMATAITEASTAMEERRAAEDAIRAENDALAAAQARARKLGLVVELIPLSQISTRKLIRDRNVAAIDYDLDELKASLKAVGLSNPIRVEPAGEDAFELIQGLRRLTAYRALYEETGDPSWGVIPASITPVGEDLEGLYRRMVDENLVRKDVSFAEMAMLAGAYAADPETPAFDLDDAVKALFGSASYQKRSYIRAFAELMERIDKYLEYPQAIPRNLGLALRARMKEAPELTGALQKALKDASSNRSIEDELAILRRYAGTDAVEEAAAPPRTPPKAGDASEGQGAGQTRFTLTRPLGEARCAASKGRLVIQGPEDFGAHSPAALARAVKAFYAALD